MTTTELAGDGGRKRTRLRFVPLGSNNTRDEMTDDNKYTMVRGNLRNEG